MRQRSGGAGYGPLLGRDLVSITDLTPQEIKCVLRVSKDMRTRFTHGPESEGELYLERRILASVFFEPSTRTRLSFESAMLRLGGGVVTVASEAESSRKKGESLEDTAKMLQSYASIIVIRQSEPGGAKRVADISKKPVVNAGDGTNEHPTQALLDIFTMQRMKGTISGLKVAMVGDLLNGRTTHSLALALAMFGNELVFIAPDRLQMPNSIFETVSVSNKASKASDMSAAYGADFVYMTRVQQERFTDPEEYNALKAVYTLGMDDLTVLKRANDKVKILHPFPRKGEVSTEIDGTSNAAYFAQAKNGTPVRMALLAMILRGVGEREMEAVIKSEQKASV